MDFRERMLEKIVCLLTSREGCRELPASAKNVAQVTDSMGFIYTVTVDCVGRLKNNVEDGDRDWSLSRTERKV